MSTRPPDTRGQAGLATAPPPGGLSRRRIATYAAIGLMSSSFTKNQIVAALIALFIGFGLFVLGQMVQLLPGWLAPFCNAVSIHTRFQNIARGVIDSRDVIYYFSMIFGCLLIAQTTLESRRWR